MNLRKDIEDTIKEWNTLFPFDYHWRKKYGIPFGSEKHLNTSFFHMIFDLSEEPFFLRELEKIKEREGGEVIETTVEGGAKKQILQLSEKQIMKEFENLDLSKY